MWPFSRRREEVYAQRDLDRARLTAESQHALLTAATETADAAHQVTTAIRSRLDDVVRQFEATAALITDALLICDEHASIRAINPAAGIMFGGDATKLINHPVSEFVATGVADSVGAEVDAIRLSGSKFRVTVSTTHLSRSDGSAVILMLLREVTGPSSTTDHFRAIFDIFSVGIMVVQNERIVAANPAAGKLFGQEPARMVDTPLLALLRRNGDSPEDLSSALVASANDTPFEVASHKDDGSTVQLLISAAGMTWNDAPAQLITVRDATELRRLRKIDRAGVDIVFCCDADGIITFANRAFSTYYGRGCENLMGVDIRSVLPEAELDAALINLRSLTPNSPTRRSHLSSSSPDGTMRFQDWTDHATFDADGRAIEFQRSGRDITTAIRNLVATAGKN